MFDLAYYKKITTTPYKNVPFVDKYIIYEDLLFNNELSKETILSISNIRNERLFNEMRNDGLPDYPLTYTDHKKNFSKHEKYTNKDSTLYFIFKTGDSVKVLTKSSSSKGVKDLVVKYVLHHTK
jgi:hypothetical protein